MTVLCVVGSSCCVLACHELHLAAPQVLIRRELEEAAKVLGERIRTGDATAEVRAAPRDASICCQPLTLDALQ